MSTGTSFHEQMQKASGQGSQSGGSSGHTSSHTPSYGVVSKPKPDHMIIIVDADGSEYRRFRVPSMYSEWLPIALKYYPQGVTDITKEISVRIPKTRVRFHYGEPKFNSCTYTATDDYLQARWGRRLHSTDKDWLASHPLATDDGIPTEYTLLCLQAMLEPYGMGVSLVRVRKGLLAAAPQLLQFAHALGINPFGLVDHTTDNAQAAIKMGMDVLQANKLWRFEFADEPLPGCTVVCERGSTTTSEYQVGTFGGHARYLAPRGYRPTQWVLSFQIAPLESITYQTDIVLPDYVPRLGEETLGLEDIFKPKEDVPLAKKDNNWYRETRACVLCHKTGEKMKHRADCCEDCYAATWKGYKCPTCGIRFGKKHTPWFEERSSVVGFTRYSCSKQSCDGSIIVWDKEDAELHPDLVLMSQTFEDSDEAVTSPETATSSAPAPANGVEEDEEVDTQNFMMD